MRPPSLAVSRSALHVILTSPPTRQVAGVRGADLSGTDPNDPFDYGAPVYDASFDLERPETQRGVLALCAAVQAGGAAGGAYRLVQAAGAQPCVLQALWHALNVSKGPRGEEGAVVDLGDKMDAWLRTREGWRWRGRVKLVAGRADDATATATARVRVLALDLAYVVDLSELTSTASELRAVHAEFGARSLRAAKTPFASRSVRRTLNTTGPSRVTLSLQ